MLKIQSPQLAVIREGKVQESIVDWAHRSSPLRAIIFVLCLDALARCLPLSIAPVA
jgi:hypothetical protein